MLIGFTGLARSGKSTASQHLIERGFIKVNFKDALVEELKKNFTPLLEEIVTYYVQHEHEAYTVDELFFVKPPLVRKLMQCYGTEVRRGDDFLYWIKQWAAKVDALLAEGKNVVVDDVRFLNEAWSIHGDRPGKVIRIERTDMPSTTDNHQSESEMASISADYTIRTDQGDLPGLYKQLDEVIHRLSVAS